jgi:hypothetical protein
MRSRDLGRCGIALVLVASATCKGAHDPPHAGGGTSGSGFVHPSVVAPPIAPPVDWTACNTALRRAATEPLDVRPQLVIDGCAVCGDWAPILQWNRPSTEKGPTRLQIESAMATCGYCNANAKQRFLGTLDAARGTSSRAPWRNLGELCKAEVSAVPDSRFTNAPFYALDRIARAAAAHGGETANLLAALELPLPAVSISGSGLTLPDLDDGVSPTAGPMAVTVMGDGLHVAKLPRARMSGAGLSVDLGNYPGDVVKPEQLGAALTKLAAGEPTTSITVLTAVAAPAQQLVTMVATAAMVAPVYLGVNAHDAPEGWDLTGTIPVALTAAGGDTLVVTAEMTAQQLATELAKRSKNGHRTVTLVAK